MASLIRYELDPARPNQLSGVLRGKLARRVRFDPVRSEAAGRPVATAWLNRDDLPTPTVRDANGQERVIDLKMRAGGFVVFHDFACKQFASSKTTLETALALSDDVVIERVFSNTPLAQLDYFQAHLLDNLNHFPVNVGPFQTLQARAPDGSTARHASAHHGALSPHRYAVPSRLSDTCSTGLCSRTRQRAHALRRAARALRRAARVLRRAARALRRRAARAQARVLRRAVRRSVRRLLSRLASMRPRCLWLCRPCRS